MSDPVQIALISACSTALPSILAAFFAWRASVHARSASITSLQTEKNTNGMKNELVALTDKEAHARGVLDQKERESSV